MRVLFLLFICNFFVIKTVCAQEPLVFVDEQVLPAMSKEYLFVSVRNWLKKQLGSADLLVNEIERGELNAMYYMAHDYDSKINYFIDIEIEEGRYTCTLSDFEIIGARSNGRNFNYGTITREGYIIPKGGIGISTEKTREAIGQKARIFVEDHAYNFVTSLEEYVRKQPVEEYRRLARSVGLVYRDSFPVRGVDLRETYGLCRLWCARFFDDANENFRAKDKQAGKLYARAYLPYQCDLELDNMATAYEDDFITFPDFRGDVAYTVEFEIRNGFCKTTVADFSFIGKKHPRLIKDKIQCLNFEDYPEIGAAFDLEVCEEMISVTEAHADWLMGSVKRHVYHHLTKKTGIYNNDFPKKMLVYQDVVKVEDRNKGELWDNALGYIFNNYESPETLPEIRDEASGELFFTSFLEYEPYAFNRENTSVGIILFDVYLQIRDEAYSYSFSNFRHQAATWLEEGITLGAVLREENCLQFTAEMSEKRQRKICEEIKALISERVAADEKELMESMRAKAD